MVTASLPWLRVWCSVHLKKCRKKALLYIGWTIGCFNHSEDRQYNFIYLFMPCTFTEKRPMWNLNIMSKHLLEPAPTCRASYWLKSSLDNWHDKWTGLWITILKNDGWPSKFSVIVNKKMSVMENIRLMQPLSATPWQQVYPVPVFSCLVGHLIWRVWSSY